MVEAVGCTVAGSTGKGRWSSAVTAAASRDPLSPFTSLGCAPGGGWPVGETAAAALRSASSQPMACDADAARNLRASPLSKHSVRSWGLPAVLIAEPQRRALRSVSGTMPSTRRVAMSWES